MIVIQMRWITPQPLTLRSTRDSPALIAWHGLPLAPRFSMAALPFAPVGFSKLVHRVDSSRMRYRSSAAEQSMARLTRVNATKARRRQVRCRLNTTSMGTRFIRFAPEEALPSAAFPGRGILENGHSTCCPAGSAARVAPCPFRTQGVGLEIRRNDRAPWLVHATCHMARAERFQRR